MTSDVQETYYKLLAKKHAKTDWNSLESIKAYNKYRKELRKLMEEADTEEPVTIELEDNVPGMVVAADEPISRNFDDFDI